MSYVVDEILRGSTQVPIHPVVMILTMAPWILVKMKAKGSSVALLLPPQYFL